MKIIEKFHPVVNMAFIVIGIFIGLSVVGEKIRDFFSEDEVDFIQEYIFLEPTSKISYRSDNSNICKAEKRARSFAKKITDQQNSFNIYFNDVFISAFREEVALSLREFFCDSINIPQYEEKECMRVPEGYYGNPYIAIYSFTNTSSYVLKDIKIILAVFENDSDPVFSFDRFLHKPIVEDGCLNIKQGDEDIRCIAKKSGTKPILIESLRPGEKILIPLYNWYPKGYERIWPNKKYFYDGLISTPMTLPMKVFVKDRKIIDQPKKMSETPIFRLGEFEIRG